MQSVHANNYKSSNTIFKSVEVTTYEGDSGSIRIHWGSRYCSIEPFQEDAREAYSQVMYKELQGESNLWSSAFKSAICSTKAALSDFDHPFLAELRDCSSNDSWDTRLLMAVAVAENFDDYSKAHRWEHVIRRN